MLCRRRQRPRCPLAEARGRSIIGNEPLNITPSFNIMFSLAVLFVDWSTSYSHSRVFNSSNRSVE